MDLAGKVRDQDVCADPNNDLETAMANPAVWGSSFRYSRSGFNHARRASTKGTVRVGRVGEYESTHSGSPVVRPRIIFAPVELIAILKHQMKEGDADHDVGREISAALQIIIDHGAYDDQQRETANLGVSEQACGELWVLLTPSPYNGGRGNSIG